jgi:hypothetical protein
MDQIRHIGLPDGRSFVHHHGTAGAGDVSDEDDEIEQARDMGCPWVASREISMLLLMPQ